MKNSDLESPYQKADILASNVFGEMGLFSLRDDQLDQIIDLKKADKLILFATGKSKLNIIEKKEEREILPIDTLLNDTEIEPILYWAP